MKRRQTIPRQWLIVTDPSSVSAATVAKLPMGGGLLVVGAGATARDREKFMRRIRHLARSRDLVAVHERDGQALRVHNLPELRAALLRRTPLILLSPIYPTNSHPDWPALPRMRAAALSRLSRRRLVALGGMNERRFARVRALGFQAWAGISAFRT